jgi:biotin carboxyl carrier protein
MKIKVNGNEYEVELLGNKAIINGKEITLKMDGDEITIPGKNKFYLDYIQEGEPSFMIINGMAYYVSKNIFSGSIFKELKAPMSGQILDVSALPGMEVNRGGLVIVLEAMKMENQIRSPIRGKVKEVRVKKGQSVRSGDILLTFE